jgi:hypothetical protein
VFGATIPVGANLASAALIDLTPTPTVKNSRIRANTHTIAPLTLPIIPAAPIRRWACSRLEVGLFMASPFFGFSDGEEIPHQSALRLRREA